MNKKIIFSTLTLAAAILMMLSCRREIEERPLFPSAEYFAPTIVEQGGELTIRGFVLTDAKVTIGGLPAEVKQTIVNDTVDDQRTVLVVTVPGSLGNGEHIVRVEYKDKGEFTFQAPLIIANTRSTVNELLIGDFDGGGIRPAVASSDFTNGQWAGSAGANSTIGITNQDGDVSSSPAGGNFAFTRVVGNGILPGTFGYVAAIDSRNEIQNNFITSWPKNFAEYPNSTITIEEGDLVSNFRVNFYIKMNGNIHTQVRVYLGNSDLGNADKYAHTIHSKATTNQNPSGKFTKLTDDFGWVHLSIPFNVFACNFGFNAGCTPKLEDLKKINQISFSISDDFNNVYDTECCTGSSNTSCCGAAIKEPVSAYIDHVVISKGGPAVNYGN